MQSINYGPVYCPDHNAVPGPLVLFVHSHLRHSFLRSSTWNGKQPVIASLDGNSNSSCLLEVINRLSIGAFLGFEKNAG